MIAFRYSPEKALASVLFLARELSNRTVITTFHQIFKILYLAEQKHLARYGRPIVGDWYVAMKLGPVPSKIYDALKAIKGIDPLGLSEEFKGHFDIDGHYYVKPLSKPNMDELSDSDVECLRESLEENTNLSFDQRTDKTHDLAWRQAGLNNPMSFEDIAKEAGADEDMIEFIKLQAENEHLLT